MTGRFLEVACFELRYYLRRVSTWIYFGIFFAVAFFFMNALGGAWESVTIPVGGSDGNVKVNSPYVVSVLTGVLGVFGVLVTAALLGNSVYRDFETGIHTLFFTSPVSRFSYLGGRFTGALVVAAVVFASIPLGLLVGSVMPYLDADRLGPFRLMVFVQPYLVLVLPNLLFTGAIFFALAAVTRQMLPNHVGGVMLLVAYLLSSNLTQDLENERVAALLDPFGLDALSLVTKYWTPVERNALLPQLEGMLLWNRLLWIGVGLGIFAVCYARFRFSHVAPEWTRRKRAAEPELVVRPAHARPARLALPEARRSFGFGAHLQQYLSMTRRSFRGIVANRYFAAIVGAGLLFLVIGATEMGKMYGTSTWPVTYQVLEILSGFFALFMLIVITFYAGELVWRERDVRLSQVHDATPVPTWVPFASKLTALALVVAVLQAVILLAGMLTQAAKGYTRFEPRLYVETLFGLQLADYLLLCALVMLVQVLVNNKYLGHLLVVLYFVFSMFMDQFGLEHRLYRYGSDAGYQYSDMNRHGPYLAPFLWFKLYWAGWALLFAVLSNLFWVRGEETGAAWRARIARLRFRRPALMATGVAVLLVLGLGGFIFYNTNVLNDYRTGKDRERTAAAYERLYKRFEGIPQPRVVGVRVAVDIFPERRDVDVRGTYRLRNKTRVPIDSLHLRIPREVEIRRLALSRPAIRVLSDRGRGYHIYRLAAPLQPGDSLRLEFDLALDSKGFENRVDNLEVVENGTFFNSGALPSLGYDPNAEIPDDNTRKKHGLRPKERMPRVDDPRGPMNTYISRDADWVDFEATISTSPDQIAIAPGYLQREWTRNGRRYFHYRMDAPILNFYSFLSARYAVRKDRWRGPDGREVSIEVYHHPGHPYNVDRMIYAVKKSLDYFTRSFGPYQHRQVRILEFPRYASFAQSFPNTIPYSEAIGFIARVADEDDIDYPFYVTAHEVAHQWWAHQVIGGNVQGSTLMAETLSQYSALMVMEKEYGRAQMRKFLEYELDNYLTGRTTERKKEMPLLLVENQPYIHYNKGSVVMYALRDHIGEERLNAALARYLRDKRFQEPPYTSSVEFLGYLREATPDSLQYVLTDMFERITLYDNRAKAAASRRLPDGRYEVVLDVEAQKFVADSLGNERPVPMRDLVDVGVFGAAPKGKDREEGPVLYLAKHRIGAGPQRIRVVVPRPPASAGVDPYHKLVDRHGDDNVVEVKDGGD
ncbi:MAG TPA: M1 family aminopeptidase [Longimicrobiaceae bacterium]|nr:M1 family aminopeptidase [Longimicrobiaceae bacterium]